ncbi:MAG: tetratricopeptide repeat protein [Thermodesulfobacteriota bacterium]
MPTFARLQIPPPGNWEDFETLCCDLWREIWEDPNTQKNGRQGQAQHGVDIYGRPNQENSWAGVQAKGKDHYIERLLTEHEVGTEVEKAKSFKPKLSQFIVATTGPKDAKLEELARTITEKHLRNGLFSVHIWGWDDIVMRLAEYPKIIEKNYPEFGFSTRGVRKEDIDEVKSITQEILKNTGEIKSKEFTPVVKENVMIINIVDTSTTALTIEYQAELDHSRDLVNDYKPKQALEFLEKLKKRIWSNAGQIVKYRLLTNIGAAKLAINQEEEAAKLFLEALQHNPDDEKALCNSAFGYLLLGQLEEAITFVTKVLEKNPASSRAYALLIGALSTRENFEEIIASVPEPYRTSEEVAYAIAHLARKKGNLAEAERWLQIAVENGKESSHETRAALGEIMLQRATERNSLIYGSQLDDSTKEEINEAIQLLTHAWEVVSNTDLRNFRTSWIVNRSIAKRLLDDLDGATKDIEIAMEIVPSNPTFIKHRAILAYETNDTLKAIDLLKKIQTAKETPEASLLLAKALRKVDKFLDAKEIIEEFLQRDLPNSLKEEANRALINIYLDCKDFESAKKISDFLRASNPTNILNLVYAGRVSRFVGKSEDAISILEEAEKYLTDSSTFREIREVASEFYSLEQFEDAARAYEKIVDKSLDTSLTRELVNAYYRAGELSKALDVCQALREKYGPLRYVSEMESAIYEEIGDLEESKSVCKEYLSAFPNDFEMKLRLAVVNLRTMNFKELEEFLQSSIDIATLSFESGLLLANLYATRNLHQKSFEIIYEIRRTFFNLDDAHLKYITFFLPLDKQLEPLLDASVVSVDTAVCLEDSSDQKEWYIVENREDADISRKEINTEHHLAQKLLGKSVGDKILLKESKYSTEYAKVIEIKSKYEYAFHESLRIAKSLPDTPGLWMIKVEQPEKEGELPKGLQKLLDEGTSQREIRLAEQLYIEGKITIGAFANLVGKNVLEVSGHLMGSPDVGLLCCKGNIDERNYAISLLNSEPRLIVDIISIITIHGIEAANFIVKEFGKLGIAQSTIDLFQEIINQRKMFSNRELMTIVKEGAQFLKKEISAGDVKRNIDYLESIMNWIESNCEVLPCKTALSIKRTWKQELDKTLGQSFIDTILIAGEAGNILYSDDERLRSFAKGELNIEGLWTQIILMDCLNKNIVEKAKYNEIVIKLACSHYYHTSIDADVLIEAARQAKWAPSEPYTTVLQILSGKKSDELSALIVATDFLFELWRQPILAQQRDYLILSLLDVIVTGRNGRRILDGLILNIKKRFFVLPLAEKQVLLLIEIWKQVHVT